MKRTVAGVHLPRPHPPLTWPYVDTPFPTADTCQFYRRGPPFFYKYPPESIHSSLPRSIHQLQSSMASHALFLWPPQPSSTSAQEPSLLDPEPKETTPPLPKPKPKRGGKASTATKKNPQRGLGVAQLERIRLQERIKKLSSSSSTDEIRPFPVNLPSIYEQQTPPICYMPQYRIGGQGVIGYGPVSAVRSVLHEQYAMDRVRIGSGSLVAAELPSNQRAAAARCVVFDHHCEFCARKKLLMRENQLGFSCGNGVDHYFLMDEERRGFEGYSQSMMGGFVKEREIKEYDFFPHNSIGGSHGGGLELGERMVGVPSSSSSSSAVDLSLKLF